MASCNVGDSLVTFPRYPQQGPTRSRLSTRSTIEYSTWNRNKHESLIGHKPTTRKLTQDPFYYHFITMPSTVPFITVKGSKTPRISSTSETYGTVALTFFVRTRRARTRPSRGKTTKSGLSPTCPKHFVGFCSASIPAPTQTTVLLTFASSPCYHRIEHKYHRHHQQYTSSR